MKWLKIIGWVLKYGTFVSSFGFIITVSIQVFSRYILENVPVWTEEASRILFIYSIAFASGLAYKGNYFVKLDLYHKKKFPQFEITLNILSLLVSLCLFGLMSIYSINILKMLLVIFLHKISNRSNFISIIALLLILPSLFFLNESFFC